MAVVETDNIAFAGFRLDLRTGRLFSADSGEITLRRKSLELLIYLAGNADRIVSKRELMDAVWRDVTVTEDSLTQCISDIRRELRDTAQSLIRTIPRRGYLLSTESSAFAGVGVTTASTQSTPAFVAPDRPSIAVLPFANMSGDPEQDIFADGLTEDLITALSRDIGLFVIARHSSFAYKGKPTDIRPIARNLGVRFILEGSARCVGTRVRINVQLNDAVGGGSLWAERFDRDLADVFAVQDEVIAKIIDALTGRLGTPHSVRSRTKNLLAYDRCVRGRTLLLDLTGSRDAVREACLLLRQAISLDPQYAEAFRWLAWGMWGLWSHGIDPTDQNRCQSLEMAQAAVRIDPEDAANHAVLGHRLAFERRWSESDSEFDLAFALEPNQPDALVLSAELDAFNGQAAFAIERIRKALRLNPHPAAWYYWELGLAYYADRRYEAALEILRTDATYRTGSRRILAASLAQLGRIEEARREADLFMVTNPGFGIRRWCETAPLREGHTVELFADGYRKAGLPE